MRQAVRVGSAFLALCCGASLLFLDIQDAGDGNSRPALPIIIGAAIFIGGLFFIFKRTKS